MTAIVNTLINRGETTLTIAADHPAFAGHFPGKPIVPGVVLLDEALHAIGKLTGRDLSACQISNVKFLSPVAPGEPVLVRFETGSGAGNGGGSGEGGGPAGKIANGTIRFDILSGERKVATGSVRPREPG